MLVWHGHASGCYHLSYFAAVMFLCYHQSIMLCCYSCCSVTVILLCHSCDRPFSYYFTTVILLASHSAALLSSDFVGAIQLYYSQAFPLSYCFASVILLCHCHDLVPVMLLFGLCHTTLPVMLPANLTLHCKYHKACHCQATVPLSSVFAVLMLVLPLSCYFRTVIPLSHCHVTLPLSGYMTTRCDQLVVRHLVAYSLLRNNSLQRLLIAVTTPCTTTCCSDNSLRRQMVAMTNRCNWVSLFISGLFWFQLHWRATTQSLHWTAKVLITNFKFLKC